MNHKNDKTSVVSGVWHPKKQVGERHEICFRYEGLKEKQESHSPVA
jgi:hypothetical protein